jgi:hypothetical protein
MSGVPGATNFDERRRLPFVAAVLAALALAGVASVAIHPTSARPSSGSLGTAAESLPGASSTAWFCAGPLPVGTPHEASSLAIVNGGASAVAATVTVATAAGGSLSEPISVPGEAESAVGFVQLHATTAAAARVIVEGTTAEVVELVHGLMGPDAAPCVRQATATQYLAAGSTQARNDVQLALYNPGATPAVAAVSFATPGGTQSPPALQGVLVPAGHVVVLDVAHSLPFRRYLAVTISSSGGGIVAGALDSVVNGGVGFQALESPVAKPAAQWFFPAAPAGASAQQTFDLFNPGQRPAVIEVRLGGPGGVGEITLSLAAGATTRYTPAPDASPAAERWAVVTSTNGVPIVAARELLVASVIKVPVPGRSAAARRRAALSQLPTLPAGFTITSGVTAPARLWVLPGGQSDTRISEFVTVANPASSPATVWIRPMKGSFAGLVPSTVPADSSIVVDLADLPAAWGRLSLRVTSDRAVVAGGELYVKGSAASPGLTAPAAFGVG